MSYILLNRTKDISGNKYGDLVVIDFAGYLSRGKQNTAFWNCQCLCGNNKTIRADLLISKMLSSCGCKRGKKSLEIGMSNMGNVWNSYLQSSRKRGLDFELKKEDAIILFKSNCFYCGCEPSQIKKEFGCYGEFIYNGIDRVDNNKGYVLNNCVPCCKQCNQAKSTYSLTEFKEWICKLYKSMDRG